MTDAPDIRPDTRNLIALGGLPLAITLALALPIPLLGDRLPDPLASHWPVSGAPDGSTARAAMWLVPLGIWLMLWAGALIVAVRRARRDGPGAPAPERIALLTTGGFLAGVSLLVVTVNADVARWQGAAALGPAAALPPILGGALLALAGWACGRGRAGRVERGAAPAPATVGLGERERAVWVGRATSPVLGVVAIAGALVLGAAGVMLGGPQSGPLIAGAVVFALAVAMLVTIRVTVSARGVAIAFGPFGAPVKRIPLADVERADATLVDPLRWGGWGYRVGVSGTRTAVVLRRGPGLVLELRGGRRFAVTVDRPEPGAGLLNDLLRSPAAPG